MSRIPFCPGLNARELINPSKTAEEVEGEAQEGQKAYAHSYNAYLVGKKNKKICIIHKAFTVTTNILSLYPSVM